MYVQALASSTIGSRVVIVAPALDWAAQWDTARGRAVVENTLRDLPPRVDRRRVLMVGLSNGAFFGAAHAELFGAAIFVSGIGETPSAQVSVITGERDVRVPASFMRQRVQSLPHPVALEVVPGADHGLLLTHTEVVARRVRAVLDSW